MEGVDDTGLQPEGVLGEAREKWVVDLGLRIEAIDELLGKVEEERDVSTEDGDKEEDGDWSEPEVQDSSLDDEAGTHVEWRAVAGWHHGTVVSADTERAEVLSGGILHHVRLSCIRLCAAETTDAANTGTGTPLPPPPPLALPHYPTPPTRIPRHHHPRRTLPDRAPHVHATRKRLADKARIALQATERRYEQKQHDAQLRCMPATSAELQRKKLILWAALTCFASRSGLLATNLEHLNTTRSLEYLLGPVIRRFVITSANRCPPSEVAAVTAVLTQHLSFLPQDRIEYLASRATAIEVAGGAPLVCAGEWPIACFVSLGGRFTPNSAGSCIAALPCLYRPEQVPETLLATTDTVVYAVRRWCFLKAAAPQRYACLVSKHVGDRRVGYAKRYRTPTVPLLRSCPFFTHWDEESLDAIVSNAELKLFPKGTELQTEGSSPSQLLIMAEGKGVLMRSCSYDGLETCAMRAHTTVVTDPAAMNTPWVALSWQEGRTPLHMRFLLDADIGKLGRLSSEDPYVPGRVGHVVGHVLDTGVIGLDGLVGAYAEESFVTTEPSSVWVVKTSSIFSKTRDADIKMLARWKAVRAAGIITTVPIKPVHLQQMQLFSKLDAATKKNITPLLKEACTRLRVSYHPKGVVFEEISPKLFVGFVSHGALRVANSTHPAGYGPKTRYLFAEHMFNQYNSSRYRVKACSQVCLWTLAAADLAELVIKSPHAGTILPNETLPDWVVEATAPYIGEQPRIPVPRFPERDEQEPVEKQGCLPDTHPLIRLAGAQVATEAIRHSLSLIRCKQGAFYEQRREHLWEQLRQHRATIAALGHKGVATLLEEKEEDRLTFAPRAPRTVKHPTCAPSVPVLPSGKSATAPYPRQALDFGYSTHSSRSCPTPYTEAQQFEWKVPLHKIRCNPFAPLSWHENRLSQKKVQQAQKEHTLCLVNEINERRKEHTPLGTSFGGIKVKWDEIEETIGPYGG